MSTVHLNIFFALLYMLHLKLPVNNNQIKSMVGIGSFFIMIS